MPIRTELCYLINQLIKLGTILHMIPNFCVLWPKLL